MSRCTCVGPNPDCIHCNGSGEIPEKRAAALIDYACRPESVKIHPGVRPPKVEGMISNPKKVVRRTRPQKECTQSHALSFRARADLPAGWTVCRRCGTRLKFKNRKSHEKHCPRRECIIEYVPPAGKPLRRNPQVSKANSAKSTSEAYAPGGKSRSANARVRAAARSAVRASIKSKISDATACSDQTVKNQDATYAYGTHYRENDRFGSHPSHDGFDDESGPD